MLKSIKSKFVPFMLALLIVVATIIFISTNTANASEDECVPQDAWSETVFDHWQRYSWTGGDSETAPAFPGEGWQANVQGDPHARGVEGAYSVARGNSGNSDWFYLESVETTVEHKAVTCDEETPVEEEPTDPIRDCDTYFDLIESGAKVRANLEFIQECVDNDNPPVVDCPEGTLPSAGGECYPCEEGLDGVCFDEPDVPVTNDKPGVPNKQVKTTTETSCVGGALVTKTTDAKGNSTTSYANGDPSCAQVDADGEAFQEEGM